jgi:DNA-binding FadR family transcriptional regulator
MSAMIRVKDETRAILRDLAREMNEPIQEVLAKAVEAYRRRRILELSNAAYAALRADPQVWQDVLDERAAWDVTLADGLEGDEWPHTGAGTDE